MPPVIPNPANIHEFASEIDFERWLATNHASAHEIWIKVHKKGSGLTTVTTTEALDVALCWGWIDAIRKSLDETSFLQRYTPRTKKSIWSIINTEHVARLIKAKRMQAPGHVQIEAAKADGRWEKAYGGARVMTTPGDLMAAIDANVKARETYDTLSSQNRYALAFRLANIKTDAARTRNIAAFVAMLARGETFYPNGRGTATATLKTAAAKQGVAMTTAVKKTIAKKTVPTKTITTRTTPKNTPAKKVPAKK